MATIRRWYIFGVCAVSLQAVVWAFIALLRNLLVASLGDDLSLIALQLAVIIIGTPIFLVHWLWARRLIGQDATEGRAVLRWAYLYGMLSLFLATAAIQAQQLAHNIFSNLFDVAEYHIWQPYQTAVEANLYFGLALLILGLGWFAHQRLIQHEGHTTEAHLFLRRLYVHGFAAIGLGVLTLTSGMLGQWLLYQIGDTNWRGANNLNIPAEALAGLIVGLPLWIVFWRKAQKLFQEGYAPDKESAIRKFYLYATLFLGVMTVVFNATIILDGFLRQLLNLSSQGDVRDVVMNIVLGAMVWLYHAYVLRHDEQAAVAQAQQANIRRIYWYLMAGVGLFAFLLGIGGEISVAIRALAGHPFDGNLREQFAIFTAVLIAGLPVWLIPWRLIQQTIAPPSPTSDAERRSLVRKIYLYLYLFAATMTALISAVYVASQLIELILGSRTAENLVSDMGQALAFMGIAIGVWLYHGQLLRSDNRYAEQLELAQLLGLRVVVVGQTAQDEALYEGLVAKQPQMQIARVSQLDEAGETALATADVIIATRSTTADLPLSTYKGRKLLIPMAEADVVWLGSEGLDMETAVAHTLRALNQIAQGDEVGSNKLSLGQILGYVLLAYLGSSILLLFVTILAESNLF